MLTPLLLLAVAPQPGNLAGAPVTLFVDASTAAQNGLTAHQPYYKGAGVRTTPPIDHPSGSAGQPDFAVAPFIRPGLEIDAFSTNLNWIASTDTGLAWAQEAGEGWAGIVWAVSRDTRGAVGSTMRHAHDGGHHAGDLFCYLFPDSTGVAPSLVDHTSLPVDDHDMRLSNAPSQPIPAVAAMDLFVPMLIGDPVTFAPVLGQFTGVIFSVSSATAGAVDPQWLLAEQGAVPPSGALVFRCLWSPGSGWGTPHPYLLPSRLGLDTGDDVTALAWDTHPARQRLLFASDASPDPIMFLSLKTPSSQPVPFRIKQTLVHVSERAGFEKKNGAVLGTTQALCGIDPRIPAFDRLAAEVLAVPDPAAESTLWREPRAPLGDDRFVACLMPYAMPNGAEPPKTAVLWRIGGTEATAIGAISPLYENELAELSWVASEPVAGDVYAFTLHAANGELLGTSNAMTMVR